MFRFPRAGATAVVAAAMTLTSAAPGAAQADQSAEVLDVTLPVSELVLETSSIDRGYRRVESAEDVRLTLAPTCCSRSTERT